MNQHFSTILAVEAIEPTTRGFVYTTHQFSVVSPTTPFLNHAPTIDKYPVVNNATWQAAEQVSAFTEEVLG